MSPYDHDWDRIFPAYEEQRKPNGDAIAELSKQNFVEMSDLSGQQEFQLRKKIESQFHMMHPELWTPLYSMVTFCPEMPYAVALQIGEEQNQIMNEVMRLPNIEKEWQEEHVYDLLLKLSTERLGVSQ